MLVVYSARVQVGKGGGGKSGRKLQWTRWEDASRLLSRAATTMIAWLEVT